MVPLCGFIQVVCNTGDTYRKIPWVISNCNFHTEDRCRDFMRPKAEWSHYASADIHCRSVRDLTCFYTMMCTTGWDKPTQTNIAPVALRRAAEGQPPHGGQPPRTLKPCLHTGESASWGQESALWRTRWPSSYIQWLSSGSLVDMRGVGTEEASCHYPAGGIRLEADTVPLE